MTSFETQRSWQQAARSYARRSSDAESFLLQELWRNDVSAADADAWCKRHAPFAHMRRQEQDRAGASTKETLDDFESDTQVRYAFEYAEAGRLRDVLDALPQEAIDEYERRILLLSAEGLSNRDIAKQEGVSHVTVMRHLQRAVKKLQQVALAA